MEEIRDDYMSDNFLKLAEEIDKKKSSSSTSKKRRNPNSGDSSHSISSQPLSKKKVQELMEERTAEGMETAIDNTNKGFKLLQKFGYTEGQGLGKNNTGIENPLKIVKRENNDRSFSLFSFSLPSDLSLDRVLVSKMIIQN